MKVQGTEVGLVGGQPNLATHFHVYVYTNTLIVLLVVLCLIFSELAMITNVNDKSNHSNQSNTTYKIKESTDPWVIRRSAGARILRSGTQQEQQWVGTTHVRTTAQ